MTPKDSTLSFDDAQMAHVAPLLTVFSGQRSCPKCGEANHTSGRLCRRCTVNQIAIRVMRDPAWPDADEVTR